MENDLKEMSLLVVDDSAINQRVVMMSLKNMLGKIEAANDGLEAYRKFCENHYDIVVMDGRMPVMDGYESTRKIRAYEKENSNEKPAMIIALTGSDTDEEAETCLEAGMNVCMLKPFRLNQFLEILKDFN
ncbi:MAG TPA: response regulator [Sunxiuqinia sp.]|nr:response regulator [Sunxiuqinia sp.]